MKKYILIATSILVASCSSNLEDLNKNIKDPAAVSGESLFTGAQKALIDEVVEINVNENNTQLWSQFLQETTYADESNYDQVTRTIPENLWSAMYRDALKDLTEAGNIISETAYVDPEGDYTNNKLQIIEIMKIYAFSHLIETFGDVPYTEALNIDILSPKYDDGMTVYKDLIARLTTAIAALDTNTESFVHNEDNLYGGDVASWIKFGNSLKLRMGIVLADADNAFAKTTVESAIAGGIFTSSDDNANLKYRSAAPNTHPVHTNVVLSGRNDYVAGTTIIDIMQPRDYEYLTDSNEDGVIDTDDQRTVVEGSETYTDPRLKYYFASNVDGDSSVPQTVYLGGEIGTPSTYSLYSHLSDKVIAADAPGVIMSYSEVQFLLAEAAARTYNTGDTAANHYAEAITASILEWGGTMAEATDYLALPSVDYVTALAASSATTPWKEVIGTQRYISLFKRGAEAWLSIRLMDYPVMAVPTEAQSGFPNRYTYPIVEQTINATNYNAASSAIGGDTPEQKLFFDKF